MSNYVVNDVAEQLAVTLIDCFHPHLIGLKIAHLTKLAPAPKVSKKGKETKPKAKPSRQGKKVTLAKVAKVSSKMNALASQDFKFVIEYDGKYWDDLTADQKVALIDHELCHCGNDADGVYMKQHSLEEFREIIDRYGFWKDDIKAFAETTEKAYHDRPALQTPSIVEQETPHV